MKDVTKYTSLILTMFLLSFTAYAQEKTNEESSGAVTTPATAEPGAKKLDIEDLEKKYWTPKDTKYNVVQNRTYGKEDRFSLSLQSGLLLNDTFNDGLGFNASLNYYFNENHGLELNYLFTDLEDSEATEVFQKQLGSGTSPDFNRIQNYIGVNYNFIPFYAKVSVLGYKIIYFDFAFSPGVGMVEYERLTQNEQFNDKQSTVAFNLDITQHFFFSKHFAIRMDVRNMWYKEKVLKFGGSLKEERADRSAHTTFFNLGLQIFF